MSICAIRPDRGEAVPAAELRAALNPRRARPDYRIEALARGLSVLSLFSERRQQMRLSEIAAQTGMLMPTVYRIAMTLAADGFLEQLPDGQYRPGVKVLTLGFSALRSLDLVDVAAVRLRRLAEETGETANLAVLSGDKILYLIRMRNAKLMTANIQAGSLLPAVYTSIGKVLLAALDDRELARRVTSTSFTPDRGPRAVRDLAQLREQLAACRVAGYAMQDEEVAYGLRSVAAPVRGGAGEVIAGINVAVNAMEWTRRRIAAELAPRAAAAAADISRGCGYAGAEHR
jgi:IclR family transcriptional regulator, pca regulon regulatory protein